MRGPPSHSGDVPTPPVDPPAPASQRERLRRALDLGEPPGPTILFTLHGPPDPAWLGGVERHCAELASQLGDLDIWWCYATAGELVVLAARSPHREVLRFPLLPAQSSDQLFHPGFARAWESLLRLLGVSLVHVHHLMRLPLDVLAVSHRLGVPVVLTVHDYFAVCPQFDLVDWQESYCAGNLGGPESRCDACMATRMGMSQSTLASWRAALTGLLPGVSALVTPCHTAGEVLATCYPRGPQRTRFIPHGLATPALPVKPARNGARPLVVGFAGRLVIAKGAAVLARIVADPRAVRFRWKVLGQGGFRQEWVRALPPGLDIEWLGAYPFGALPGLLVEHEIDLLLFPAIWPETFSFVVHEAFQAGVPVLATDLGAPAERIRESGGGWLFAADSPDQALSTLERLDAPGRAELAAAAERAVTAAPRDLAAMADDYRQLYGELGAPCPPGNGLDLANRGEELLAMARSPRSAV